MNNTRTAIIEAYREARARFHAARPDGDTAGYLYDDLVEHADALLNDLDPRREIFSAAELVRIYLRGHRAEPVIWYGRPQQEVLKHLRAGARLKLRQNRHGLLGDFLLMRGREQIAMVPRKTLAVICRLPRDGVK